MGERLSQVFLTDPGWIRRCMSRIKPAPYGIEWACGHGALTEELVRIWDCGLGIELDPDLIPHLIDNFGSTGWNFIRADLTEYPLPPRPESYPLVGNLPYHITGPALMKIYRESALISRFSGLVQWEVGKRLVAEPGDSEYRGISLLMQSIGSVELPFRVPADAFDPVPNVDSAWIELEITDPGRSSQRHAEFVRLMFRHPRKTLVNNLSDQSEDKQYWRKWIKSQGWDSRRRPQTINPEEMRDLFLEWQRKNA